MKIMFMSYIMLIVGVSTTLACSSRNNVEVCDNIQVSSTGNAGIIQYDKMGLYHKQTDIVNDKSTYKHLHKEQYLYIDNSGTWMIGSDSGSNIYRAAILNNGCKDADPPVAPQCKTGWSYWWNSMVLVERTRFGGTWKPHGWTEDITISLSCIGPITCYNDKIQDNCGVEGCDKCPPPEGCDNIEIQSDGSAATFQTALMGIYAKQHDQMNGKSVYKHKHSDGYLYRNDVGIWSIGSKPLNGRISMVNKGCYYADPPVAPNCNMEWLYHDGKDWKEDKTIRVNCIKN